MVSKLVGLCLCRGSDASHQCVEGVLSRAVIVGLGPPCCISLYQYEVQGEANTVGEYALQCSRFLGSRVVPLTSYMKSWMLLWVKG